MGFGKSYKGVIFFIGIATAMISVSHSNSKIEYQSSNQRDQQSIQRIDNLHDAPSNSMLNTLFKANTPAPLETTLTASQTDPIPLKNPAPWQNPSSVPLPSIDFLPLLSQNRQVKCEPLNPRYIIKAITDILTPELFSEADRFRYLVEKTMKIKSKNMPWVRQILNNYLQDDRLPRCYVPYAKVLFSLLRYWPDMDNVGTSINTVQKLISKSDADLSFLPSGISLWPELLELFSGEIFDDPAPPLRIFYKLMDMSKNDLLNVETQLQQFIEQAQGVRNIILLRSRFYLWYAQAVRKFLQNGFAIDDLKREMIAIQGLANSGQR